LQTISLPSHRNKFKKKRIHFHRDKQKFLQLLKEKFTTKIKERTQL